MTTIYAAPPWRILSQTWGEEAPVRVSRSLFSAARHVTSAGPRRRVVALEVAALDSGARDGAGLSTSMARLLDGGVNLVRLPLPGVNWHLDAPPPPHDLAGAAWVATVTTLGGFAALRLTGRTPGAVVCRAYDLIGVYVSGALAGTARAVKTVTAGIDGVAIIPLFSALPAGVVRVDAPATMVCEALQIPDSAQPLGGQWSLVWRFREVLAGEFPDDAPEVDPWS
jgi:hypothetical protein